MERQGRHKIPTKSGRGTVDFSMPVCPLINQPHSRKKDHTSKSFGAAEIGLEKKRTQCWMGKVGCLV